MSTPALYSVLDIKKTLFGPRDPTHTKHFSVCASLRSGWYMIELTVLSGLWHTAHNSSGKFSATMNQGYAWVLTHNLSLISFFVPNNFCHNCSLPDIEQVWRFLVLVNFLSYTCLLVPRSTDSPLQHNHSRNIHSPSHQAVRLVSLSEQWRFTICMIRVFFVFTCICVWCGAK